MARQRYNGLTATLDATGLTAAATSIGFTAALSSLAGAVPTLAAGDYIVFVVDSEIIHLTAYTTGALTGTIERAKEGTTAATHAAGATVSNDPTIADFVPGSAVQRMRRTTGDITVTATSQAALPGVTSTMDITVPAKAGDALLVGIDLQFDNGTGTIRPDVYTVVSGSLLNSIAGVATNYGVPGWTRPSGSFQYVSGAYPYIVQAGDVVAGQVTLRPTAKVDSGSRIIGGSAGSPFTFFVSNTSA